MERSVKDALGRTPRRGYAECVPRPRRDLTTTEKRHLHSLEGRIARLEAELQATRREWAELVEEAGQAAVARELGVSRQAVADRLRRIRANRRGGAVGGEGRKGPLAFSRGRVYRALEAPERREPVQPPAVRAHLGHKRQHRKSCRSARNLRAPDGGVRYWFGRSQGRSKRSVFCLWRPLRGRPRRTALPFFSRGGIKVGGRSRSRVPE